MKTLRERFESKVDRDGPIPAHRPELGQCHVWTGWKNRDSYGKLTVPGPVAGKRVELNAHRVALFLEHGRWPEPCALHHCDNPACVRPSHLFEGTRSENMRDMTAKGRRATGERCSATVLTEQDVRDIRANFALCRVSQRELARRFGVHPTTVGRVVRGQQWR